MRTNQFGYGSVLGAVDVQAQQAANTASYGEDACVRTSAMEDIQRRLSALFDQLGYTLETATCIANRTLGSVPDAVGAGGPQTTAPGANGSVEMIHLMLNEIYERANRLGEVVGRLERLG